MKGRRRLILDKAETDYLRSQIDSGDNIRIKNALQSLSKWYRRGITVHPSQVTGVVNSVIGTAFNPAIDEKVRRWVLNAIARVGTEGACVPAVLHLIKGYPDEPGTVAAGIAAIYKLCSRSNPDARLAGINFDPQLRTLAALQHVPASQLDLRHLPIDVEVATSELLKHALLVVGLDRSPENLLNPRHSDSEMVKALGRHHDPIVSQYSVWAITENDKLRLAHLGIDLKEIENQPENVRSWLFQLLGMEATDTEPHWEYIRLGMDDPSKEARKGLAVGLKATFVDVFEPMIMDWVANEPDPEVRQHIMEHIVRQAGRSRKYERYAIEVYDGEPTGSTLRQSMEASAVQTPMYAKFKQIGAGAPDLFEGASLTMVEKQYNFGSITAGAMAFDNSEAVNHGTTNVQSLTQQQVQTVVSELAALEAAVHESSLTGEQKQQALTYVSEAKEDPSPSKIGKVIEYIGYLGALAEAGTALAPYAAALTAALGM